jgi:orotidine-5'-phosphate decarboxylase
MLIQPRDRLIVALDLPSVTDAQAMVAQLGESVTFYKVGYQLTYAGGLDFAKRLIESGKQVFMDLKLHDIGNTVARGVESIAGLGATFLTVHAYPQTMRAAVEGRGSSGLRILAVTVLTSYDENDMKDAGYAFAVQEMVTRRAQQAREIGIDGIVCAPEEANALRPIASDKMVLVTPGVRPAGSDTGDQKRIMTPGRAIREGADYLVVGRPVTASREPKAAAESIVAEIADAAAVSA